MKTSMLRTLLLACCVMACSVAISLAADAPAKIVRGWLSDEGCATGRANSGVYTGTNPDCAKKCVAQGKKIVLIVPDEKVLLKIDNQDAALKNVGDFVEVSGTVDPQSKTVHIATLKMLEKGAAMCEVPPKKSKQ